MTDNPYPDGSGMKLNMGRNTMHYELHTAWDEGYAEGFAAGRAAADEPWREAIAFINWFAEGPCGCDGDPQDPCDSCRALALLTRLDDLAGRAAASTDRWTLASDNPAAPQWECELCGGKLAGPGEKCGSAQHGPAGTVVYGRAVPSGGPIPDSEFGVTSTVLDPKTGIAEPVTTGRIPDAEFVEPPLMPPAASPDSPDDRESLIAAEFFAAGMRAASPDERLREALRVMIDVFDRHDRWCGHYADAPGDGIIHKVPAARAALAADREAPDEPKETT